MPTYYFACAPCEKSYEVVLRVADRKDPQYCSKCEQLLDRRPEPFRARTFEPYYDEALGCDVHTEEEKQQILRENGWVEAGDTVGGSRNIETSANATLLDKQPLAGIPYKGVRTPDEDFNVVVESESGVERTVRLGDLPTPADLVDNKKADDAFKTPAEGTAE